MEENVMVVESLRRKDKVLINPLSLFTKQQIEEGLRGEIVTDHDDRGFRYKISFKGNPYGAIILKCTGSYGMETDNWGIVVTYEGCPYYDSPIGYDTWRWFTEEQLIDILVKIRNLGNSSNGEIR